MAEVAKPCAAKPARHPRVRAAAPAATAKPPPAAAAADPAPLKVSGKELCSTAALVRVVAAAAFAARSAPSGDHDRSGHAEAGTTAAGHPVVRMLTVCRQSHCCAAPWWSRPTPCVLAWGLNELRHCCAQALRGVGPPCSSGRSGRWNTPAACTPATCSSWRRGAPE